MRKYKYATRAALVSRRMARGEEDMALPARWQGLPPAGAGLRGPRAAATGAALRLQRRLRRLRGGGGRGPGCPAPWGGGGGARVRERE